ncbi:MAG: DUF58 domain-containing protein [Treponema sp.]|jgi:hypothetical protein|nr:DUF58 domain-containing protein [Treponema sp.]
MAAPRSPALLFRRFRGFEPVLSPAGFAVLVLALFILIRSLSSRNAYEIVLSLGILCLWSVLCFAGSRKARRLAALEPGWKPPAPLAAGGGEESLITGLDIPVPWFFRLHFTVRGRFFPAGGQEGCRVLLETSAPRKGPARLSMDFPLSGIFRGEGACRLRDIFGFFSFPCGLSQRRSLAVRSAPCLKKPLRISARSGAEDRRNKSSSDDERYYMREYAPGDRFRDINWKSSERIETLITRISPDNQEKISRIEVYFRNYGPAGGSAGGGLGAKLFKDRPSLEDLWLLDRAKARLSYFLRSVKEEGAAYVFHIRSAQGVWDIRDQEELEAFLDELAGLPFSPPQSGDAASALAEVSAGKGGELYVFSTACDTGLPAFLLARQTAPVFLFLAKPAVPGLRSGEIEKISLRDFTAKGFTPPPSWLAPRPGRVLNPPQLPGGKTELDYAEARL